MTRIARCTGYVPAVNGKRVPTPVLPGGGYQGITKRLDASVKLQAEWLQRHFPHDIVQIRFNSNQRSGGAFVAPGIVPGVMSPDFGLTCRVECNCNEQPTEHTPVVWSVYVDGIFLKDNFPSNKMKTYKTTDENGKKVVKTYYNESFDTAEKARRALLDALDPAILGEWK